MCYSSVVHLQLRCLSYTGTAEGARTQRMQNDDAQAPDTSFKRGIVEAIKLMKEKRDADRAADMQRLALTINRAPQFKRIKVQCHSVGATIHNVVYSPIACSTRN